MSEPRQNLKLKALDEHDVQVLGAVLQDAIAPVCDMAFKGEDQNFVMVVHRFLWDCADASGAPAQPGDEGASCRFERVCCALDIEGVESVQYQGFDQEDAAGMLDLLTMAVEGGCLHIIFAGGAKLRLKLGKWRIRLEDFGESWPVACCPRHAT